MIESLGLIKESYESSLGRQFVNLNFEDNNYWNKLKKTTSNGSSTALIDNTTFRNALLLMKKGLGAQDSMHAALLPDFAVLFFALTHFEKLILLNHGGLTSEEKNEIDSTFQGAIDHIFVWDEEMKGNNDLEDDLYRKFNSIQSGFKENKEVREDWSSTWSDLLKENSIEPKYFSDQSIDSLLSSPSFPLHTKASDLSSTYLEMVTRKFKSLFLSQKDFDQVFQLSVYASYHTYRSIFYFSVAEYLSVPYLPCGVRGVASNFLPIRYLNIKTDPLNPDLQLKLQQLAQLEEYRKKPPVIEMPVLRLNPTLATVFNKMKQYNKAINWQNIVKELRAESDGYRKEFSKFIKIVNETNYDLEQVLEYTRAIGLGRDEKMSKINSFVGISGNLAEAYLTQNPASTIKDVAQLITENPVEFIKSWMLRRKLKFIIRASDLAANSLSLKSNCEKIWGRSFTVEEETYLERMKNLKPTLFG